MNNQPATRDQALDVLLWSIIDGQARSGTLRRARLFLGPREAVQRQLTERARLDRALRDWASCDLTAPSSDRAVAPKGLPALFVTFPVQYILMPAAVLGLAIFAASARFGLPGLYALVAALMERLP